jgi:methyl-accepting chemotaxis protein
MLQQPMKYTFVKSKTLKELKEKTVRQQNQFEGATAYVNRILEGNLDAPISDIVVESQLGTPLVSLQKHLKHISLNEQERNWLNVGLTKFADILRNKESLDLKNLADEIIANVVKYVDANQGAIFIYEDTPGDEHLEMIACYAYDRRKFMSKKINLGEGLAGQCVLEKDVIYIKKAPEQYVSITSGLGHATPREILISPMSINEKIFGVLELASFKEFPQYKIDFIKKLSENIASTIKTVRENERVISLLNSSQQQAEELRAQEEEMRQNMEELQATQEEMQRKTNEITNASAEMMSIVKGINATMATIEFTPEGKVITANANFLSAVKYKLEDIKGKHHQMFVPSELANGEEYKTFWSRLASGESLTGVFKRISSDAKVIWLNAIYNPIQNANGQVTKVVKFATDITQQEERVAETKGVLSGINATMAVAEFTPKGEILHANTNFLAVMDYSLDAIKGKHHRTFVPDEILHSEEYAGFWNRLAAGEPIAGEFKRIASGKRTVWLNAIYNPIHNSNGDVAKVIKFATNITSMKEGAFPLHRRLVD